jgi:hypothetical protein
MGCEQGLVAVNTGNQNGIHMTGFGGVWGFDYWSTDRSCHRRFVV